MHRNRALLVSLVVLVMALAAFALRQYGTQWVPGCFFRKLTGLECPGCGMTRGTYALLHGNWREAFRFNPVGMILFPTALLALGLQVLGWVRGKPLPWEIRSGRWGATIIAAVMILWFVGRNVF